MTKSMGKVIRNTIFTLIALGLTAIGLGWTHKISNLNNPVQISSLVLSASKSAHQAFPLTLEFARSYVKLGQYQELTVSTLPNAELEIVTVYPNGSINNPQTLNATADETGKYSMKFKLDDFAYLGVFETKVLARANNSQSQTTGRFAVQTWNQANNGLDSSSGYVYPLLP